MNFENDDKSQPESQSQLTSPEEVSATQDSAGVTEIAPNKDATQDTTPDEFKTNLGTIEQPTPETLPSSETTIPLVETPEAPKKASHSFKKLLSNRPLVLVIVGLVLIGAASAISYKLTRSEAVQQSETSKQSVITKTDSLSADIATADVIDDSEEDYKKIAYPSETEPYDTEVQKFTHPNTGETWLKSPKKMDKQGWIKDEAKAEDPIIYEEVGARANNTIYLVTTYIGTMGQTSELFEKSPSGKVSIVLRPQKRASLTVSMVKSVNEKINKEVVTVDDTIHYDSLNVPEKLPIGDNEFAILPADIVNIGNKQSSDVDSTLKTLPAATFGQSTLSRLERNFADTKLTNIGYQVKTPLGTVISMRYEPNGTSLKGYSFTNGASVEYKDYQNKTATDDIGAIARGCSLLTASVTRSDELTLNDLVYVGKTSTGRIVYEPKDKDGALYKKAYEEYAQMLEKNAQPKSRYVNDHGLLVIENNKKELLVYVRGQYSAVGGCAKPVVYLYPTTPTTVSVKVGAKVTVSDPLYPAGGWKNVLARPDGRLTYSGKTYGSLFWEGQGIGDYPGIASGTVVKRADAVKTIRSQLIAQGLNATETKDFMTFWEPKIPNKPFVRLTWLNTAQMNGLAPLTISPKPQTVIRVFLDMDGFDAPVALPSQQLTKVERKGFTVVEWGGLTAEGLR